MFLDIINYCKGGPEAFLTLPGFEVAAFGPFSVGFGGGFEATGVELEAALFALVVVAPVAGGTVELEGVGEGVEVVDVCELIAEMGAHEAELWTDDTEFELDAAG